MYRILRIVLIVMLALVSYSFVLLALMLNWAAVGVAAICLWIAWRWRPRRLSAFGTAAWADYLAAYRAGMVGGQGLCIGRMDHDQPRTQLRELTDWSIDARTAVIRFLNRGRSKRTPDELRLNEAVHTAVISPTGGGKGAGFVIPFLLENDESAVVIDFKGELTAIAAEARHRRGHRVVILDPFGITGFQSDTFNPLIIDPNSPLGLDDCREIANAIVVRTGQEKEPHWTDSAEAWIATMIALTVVLAMPQHRNLQSVRSILTSVEKMKVAIQAARVSRHWDGMLARMGEQLMQYQDRELGSTLTTVHRFMRFLDTVAVASSTQTSSFDPRDLVHGKMTIFLVIPPDRASAQSALLRLWIGALLRVVVRENQSRRRVFFVLDEASSLGHLDSINDALFKYRSYGVRLQFYYQSIAQLKECWPQGQDVSFMGNVTQVFMAVQDFDSAKYVSDRLGDETTTIESGGRSMSTSHQHTDHGGSTNRSYSSNSNWQQHGEKLLRPEQVLTLSPRVAITFTPGVPPIRTWITRYYESRRVARLMPARDFLKAVFLLILSFLLAVIVTFAAWESNQKQAPLPLEVEQSFDDPKGVSDDTGRKDRRRGVQGDVDLRQRRGR